MICCLSVWASAQSPADKLFEKYAGKDGFTTVYISKYMFSMFQDVEVDDPDAKEVKELTKSLSGINILTVEEENENTRGVNFYEEIIDELPVDEYQELMVIKEKDQNVQFLIREKEGRVSELLLIVGGPEDNVLMSIQGNIDLENIANLSRMIHIEGMENLEKMNGEE